MDQTTITLIYLAATVFMFLVCLIGFFRTKSIGYGKYTTSILVIVMVLFAGLLAIIAGKGEWPAFANLLFTIAGFAGGLVAPKSGKNEDNTNDQ